jgi:hypothetical protein
MRCDEPQFALPSVAAGWQMSRLFLFQPGCPDVHDSNERAWKAITRSRRICSAALLAVDLENDLHMVYSGVRVQSGVDGAPVICIDSGLAEAFGKGRKKSGAVLLEGVTAAPTGSFAWGQGRSRT